MNERLREPIAKKDAQKERLGAFTRFIDLKEKERLDKLEQSEFDELLGVEFYFLCEDLPPLGPFDPDAELENVRHAPTSQRREALENFKEKLSRQREAWANCRMFLERSIEFNNDVPAAKLQGILDRFGMTYGFTEQQKMQAKQIVDDYYDARHTAIEFREQHPMNAEAVKALTGVLPGPASPLEVDLGPMSIDITTDALTTGRLYEQCDEPTIKEIEGFASMNATGVYYTVTKNTKPHEIGTTRTHEREHIKNSLFRRQFDTPIYFQEAKVLWNRYEVERDPDPKRALLDKYLQLARTSALDKAKDEILAMKRDGSSNYFESFFDRRADNPYDFLAPVRNGKLLQRTAMEHDAVQQVLVEEYREIIEDALSAFDALSHTYGKDKAIALLTDSGLSAWPRTAKRLLQYA